MSIYQKLHEIQKACHGLGKDSKTYSYEYTSGSKVLSVVRPMMDKLSLLLKQEIIDTVNIRMDYHTKKGEPKSEILTTVKMRFTWVDCETGETDVNLFEANGMNDWDKGIGSALTYGERYFFLKFFHISTDSDDSDFLTGLRQEEERKAEAARLKAEEERKRKEEEDKKPKPITKIQMEKAIDRLQKGENILDKLLASYVLTDEQKATFETAARNANKSPENKK